MDISEMRQMTVIKLQGTLAKAIRALAVAKFHMQTGQNQDVALVKKKRVEVAQIKTVLKEKEA